MATRSKRKEDRGDEVLVKPGRSTTSDAAETITTKEHALRRRLVRRRRGQFLWKGMPRETPACHGEDNGRRRQGYLEARQRQACQGGRREDDGRDRWRSRQRS